MAEKIRPDRRVFDSRGALAKSLAEAVSRVLAGAISARGIGFLAVSGGSTPGLFFEQLAASPIDWQRVTVTLIDERLVPASSPRSNAALAKGKLLQGPAAAAKFVGLYHEGGSVEDAAVLASEALRRLPWPLDVAILGMGADGHTASFFPDADNLAALLDPKQAKLVLPVHAPSAIEPRLTLTLAAIVKARFLGLHIEGDEKRAVLDRACDGENLPIRAVIDQASRPVQIYWAA
jgi:6-phosphogluconolactonase